MRAAIPIYKHEVKALLKEIINIAQRDNNIDALYLFGSQARGDATIQSDIDFAVVSKNPSQINRGLLNYHAESYDIPSNFVYITQEGLDKADSQFDVKYWIKKEGILLWKR